MIIYTLRKATIATIFYVGFSKDFTKIEHDMTSNTVGKTNTYMYYEDYSIYLGNLS